MREYRHAIDVLSSLPTDDTAALALVHLKAGDWAAAQQCASLDSFMRIARGDYAAARGGRSNEASVAALFDGDLEGAIEAIQLDDAASEPIFSNIATLLELHSTPALNKTTLLAQAVTRASDSLDPGCLKL